MDLYTALQRPRPYERQASIWTDPRIAPQMLRAHLDSSSDSASYAPGRIDETVSFLVDALRLSRGSSLVDLGCGPGLYAERFARAGVQVTGVDISEHSIAYALDRAHGKGLDIEYRVQSYCDPFGSDCFDAAMLVWEDFGVLSPGERRAVLENVRRSLRPGGRFALDVASEKQLPDPDDGAAGTWEAYEAGFFRDHPHVVMRKTWLFSETHSFCETSVVVDGGIAVYQNHQTVFSVRRIVDELEDAGFSVETVGDDLRGAPYSGESLQIGVVAVKPQ